MLSREITECPHCGSKESYSYIVIIKGVQTRGFIVIIKGVQTRGFDGRDFYNNHCGTGIDKHGACRCDECGKIIKSKETVTDYEI